MKKKQLLTSAILVSSLMLGACGKNTESTTTTNRETQQTTVEETTAETTIEPTSENQNNNSNEANAEAPTSLQASFDNLFVNTLNSTEDKNDNVLLSPYSLVMDFGMLENGTSGDGLDEMVTSLNGGTSVDDLNTLMQDSKKKMMESNDVTWNIANSIWLNENNISDINPEIKEIVKKYYSSEINKRPYNNETLKEINNWVNDNTNGMIPSLLDEIHSDDVMHLINAVAFEGDWDIKFNAHSIMKNQEFTNLDGSTAEVDMLHGDVDEYFTNDDLEGFTKAFADNNYEFFAIKPKGDLTPAELMKKFKNDNETISSIISKYTVNENANIKVPKFKVDFGMNLNTMLQNMGIKKIFTGEADFSKLADTDSLMVSKVIQKTHFELSETGVKAAAATSIAMTKSAMRRNVEEKFEIILDKPFIYGIYDKSTSLPIFIGSMNTMK